MRATAKRFNAAIGIMSLVAIDHGRDGATRGTLCRRRKRDEHPPIVGYEMLRRIAAEARAGAQPALAKLRDTVKLACDELVEKRA